MSGWVCGQIIAIILLTNAEVRRDLGTEFIIGESLTPKIHWMEELKENIRSYLIYSPFLISTLKMEN